MPPTPPPEPEIFKSWVTDRLRYRDTDKVGHVNNAVFSTFCESGRTEILYKDGRPIAPEGLNWVIARLEMNYLSELNWPGEVETGTAVERIGTSSIVLYQGIFKDGVCAADAKTVIVLMDESTRRSAPMPPETLAALESLKLESEA